MSKESIVESLEKKSVYSSRFKFITEVGKDINDKQIIKFEKKIDRHSAINKIDQILFQFDVSVKIEEGIFEFTVCYMKTEDLIDSLFSSVYYDNVNHIIDNLKNYNTLIKRIRKDSLNPYSIAFLSPSEINPESFEIQIKKRETKKIKEENMCTTDKYKCKQCGARKSKVFEMQTRAADEPMTTFVTCKVCFTTFKF
jgi:DNA-directed RNA polymerase subunit M/transcription elongation factor TFIIS